MTILAHTPPPITSNMARFITAGGLLALVQTVSAAPLEERFVSDATTTITSAASTTVPVVPVTDVTSHGPYTGPSPTTTGALSTSVLASSIPALPAESSKYSYPADVCTTHGISERVEIKYIFLSCVHVTWIPEYSRTLLSWGVKTNQYCRVLSMLISLHLIHLREVRARTDQLPSTEFNLTLTTSQSALVSTKNGSNWTSSTTVFPPTAWRTSRPLV